MQQICEGVPRPVRSCAAKESRLQPRKQIVEWSASKATNQKPQDMYSSQKAAVPDSNLPWFPQPPKVVHPRTQSSSVGVIPASL